MKTQANEGDPPLGGVLPSGDDMLSEALGACGRRLVRVPDASGRLELKVEPTERTATEPCSRCRRLCPGQKIVAEQTHSTEIF